MAQYSATLYLKINLLKKLSLKRSVLGLILDLFLRRVDKSLYLKKANYPM